MAEGGVIIAGEGTVEPRVWVQIVQHVLIDLGYGEKVHYEISSTSTDPLSWKLTSTGRRSYSDFQNLRRLLVSRHGEPIPPLPVYRLETRLRDWFQELQDFLQQILDIPALRSDPCLYLFIQTADSLEMIRAKVGANEQPQDLLDQNRESQDQAAAEGDDNDVQQIPMHRLVISPVLPDESPERDQEAPLRRASPDGSAAALPGARPCSGPQQIPLRRPGPDEAAVADEESPGSRGSSEELMFSMEDVN